MDGKDGGNRFFCPQRQGMPGTAAQSCSVPTIFISTSFLFICVFVSFLRGADPSLLAGREGLPTSAHELDTNLSSPRSHVSTSPRRSSNNSPDSAAGKVELTFSSVPTLPMLELPKGNADSFNGKYDYSIAVDKPFAFDTPSDEERTRATLA